MGECKYCHKDAGWFSNEHDECRNKHTQGIASLKHKLLSCFSSKVDFYTKANELNAIMSDSYISGTSKEDLFAQVLDEAVEAYLNDGVMSPDERSMVARFIQFSGIPQPVLNKNHSLERMLQAEVLNDILNGRKPAPKITVAGNLPVMISRNENLIWVFRNITLHEQKVKREYVGRNRGLNIRIARGVYYRTGGFKGTPVETSYMQRISSGTVCMTDKHIYFSSPEKSLKIAYSSILNVDTFSNGVGIQKDGANSKPIFLEGLDSWFCYNVIANLKD